MELTEFIPLNRSPDPTWAVCTKFVGSPIILLSIRRRLLGWGCSAIQQLKHNQNSLMLTVHSINEHQGKFQISTQEVPQNTLLNTMNVQWCQDEILLFHCVFVPGSQVSYTVNLIKKNSDCFLSLLLVLQRLLSEPRRRYKNCCLDPGTITESHSSSME